MKILVSNEESSLILFHKTTIVTTGYYFHDTSNFIINNTAYFGRLKAKSKSSVIKQFSFTMRSAVLEINEMKHESDKNIFTFHTSFICCKMPEVEYRELHNYNY